MSNREVREYMKMLYGCRCMLTGIETDKLQYHHLTKRENGGDNTIYNGSLVIEEIHAWVHKQERIDVELFYLICECVGLYRQCLERKDIQLIEQYEKEIMPIYVKKIGG